MKKHILTLALYLLPLFTWAATDLPTTEKPSGLIDLSTHYITGGRVIEDTYNGSGYRTTRYNFDGLGRPYQRIAVKASPAGNDVIDFVLYDCMGRTDSVVYLPYTKANAPTYAGTPQEQAAFYNALIDDQQDARCAFSAREYDRSPRGLVTSLSTPGSLSHSLAGRPIRYEYRLNALPATFTGTGTVPVQPPGTTTLPGTLPGGIVTNPGQAVLYQKLDSVKRFTVSDAGKLRYEGYYPINTLTVVISERQTAQSLNVRTFDYTDSRGNRVARKVSGGSSVRWSYEVYDEAGRLRYEIPPIADDRFTTPGASFSPDALGNYCTYREYDGRGNCVLTRNPGQAATYAVYDSQDRPIFTQDGNQRVKSEWTYCKYDDYGRVLETHLVSCADEVAVIRARFSELAGYDAHRKMLGTCTPILFLSRSVYGGYDDYDLVSGTTFLPAEGTGGISTPGEFPTVTPPTGDLTMLPVQKKKVYRPFTVPADLAFRPVTGVVTAEDCYDDPTGMKIYERLAILPDAKTDTTAYVERAMYYDRKGRMVQSVTRNHLGGISRLSCRYDFPGNLLVQHEWRQAGPDVAPDVKVTRNTFDDYGRLLDSRTRLNDAPEAVMHYAYDERSLLSDAVAGGEVLHDTYRYDVAGRLTAQDNGLFSMTLRRDKPQRPTTRANYTGQVSECVWQHKNYPGTEQAYAYYYDAQGQFTAARHFQENRITNLFTEDGIRYDLNGNLLALTRHNGYEGNNELEYRYSGNKLLSVTDKDVIVKRYAYDLNGNVSQESQNGWNYQYNSLNLTECVTDKRLKTLAAYRYLADGTKIGVKDAAGNGYEYLGSLIYRRSPSELELESTDFAGGRILKTSAKYDLRYFVRDYLGSVRAIVNAQGQRLEAIDYMPYGSRWRDPMRLVTDNRFLFNGKEWQPTGDLDVLDYGARHYDPLLGRWFNPDPAMQQLNPYIYCGNNAINNFDPNGLAWRPTYSFDHNGDEHPNGYEWVEDSEAYDDEGVLKPGFYEQAIFFSATKKLGDSGSNIGSSTATVYLANGETVTFNACTVPSSNDYPTIPEGRYHAKVGLHNGKYPALRMGDIDNSQRIELGGPNPAHPERTYAIGVNIHKAGLNNYTGLLSNGSPISAACMLIDRYRWNDFISIFDNKEQRMNIVSITVSRTLASPLNANILPAFNFIMSGSRYSFFNNY